MRLAFAPYILDFKKPAGTSRGVLNEKPTVLLKIYDEADPARYGIGEAAVFPNLSPEANEDLPLKYLELCANIAIGKPTDLSRHSSIQFGLEQAIYDFANGSRGIYFPSPFVSGEGKIVTNGLIWMGQHEEMQAQIEQKLASGFKCIKLKIGAINWDDELALIESVRRRFTPQELTIRVDANGAFTPANATEKLRELGRLGIHSIEQPIARGQWSAMAELCRTSPVPIALDEELIGVSDTAEKVRMLDEIRPAYVILKPALCGAFSGASEWIHLAQGRNIGWWVTSALESNIGLNALAQWTATLSVSMPQGLGTGALFNNNFPSPLILEGENLRYRPDFTTDRSIFDSLDWHE